ncbi:hypothetical protein WJX82_009562 [Trebouxia sp. C0006]
MAQHNVENVVAIQEVQLHKVEGGQEALLEWAPFNVQLISHGNESQLTAHVGKVSWGLQTSMPTLRANAHTFMFAIPGTQMFYSVLIAESTPQASVEMLENVLMECTSYQVAGQPISKADSDQLEEEIAEAVLQDEAIGGQLEPEMGGAAALPNPQPPPPRTYAHKISMMAEKARTHIETGAAAASRYIEEAGDKLEQRYSGTDSPHQLDPKTKARIKMCRRVAHRASSTAASVTGGVADTSLRVADGIVSRMGGSNYGQKLQGSKSTRTNAAREIAAASVVAAAGIYDSMNVAANTVLQSGGQTTSSFIGHKYGPDIGEAASDLSHAAVEGGMTYFTMSRMGVRAVAKRIAKRTAKGLVKNTVTGMRTSRTGPATQGAVRQ